MEAARLHDAGLGGGYPVGDEVERFLEPLELSPFCEVFGGLAKMTVTLTSMNSFYMGLISALKLGLEVACVSSLGNCGRSMTLNAA